MPASAEHMQIRMRQAGNHAQSDIQRNKPVVPPPDHQRLRGNLPEPRAEVIELLRISRQTPNEVLQMTAPREHVIEPRLHEIVGQRLRIEYENIHHALEILDRRLAIQAL